MRVTTTQQRRVSRSAVIRQHRMDRQRFKLGSSRNMYSSKWVMTMAHTLRLRQSIPIGQCVRKAVPIPLAAKVRVPQTGLRHQTCDSLDRNALDTWSEVEDLRSRLARICHVTVVYGGDAVEVSFAEVRADDWDDDSQALIERVQDVESYRWRQEGSRGDFVQCIEFRGADLVLTLASPQQLVRWFDGENIKLMVQHFLTQLQRGGASC